MDRGGLRRLVPIIVVIIVAIISIAALVSLGRAIFSGGGASPAETSVNTGKQALTSTLADRSVRMTVRGPIVANENFYSYTISANSSARNMTTYVGYVGQQIDSSQLENNTPAYEQFVYALDRANLMEGTASSNDDIRGICATGNVYEFEVMQGENTIRKLWTSTCSGSVGTLKANLGQVSRLFQLQIPSYSTLISKIRLSN